MAAHRTPRLAARALILHEDRLLLVNAYPGGRSDLWCAPGGGARPGKSLHENLIREVHEETGLTVTVGPPCLINEFHDPRLGLSSGRPVLPLHHRRRARSRPTGATPNASSPHGASSAATISTLGRIRFKPDSLPAAAWGDTLIYDPLEVIVR